MAIHALGLFLVELAAGTSLVLAAFPIRSLGRGFVSLHGGIALCGFLLSLAAPPPGLSVPAVCGGAALLVGSIAAARAGRFAAARWGLSLAGACAVAALARLARAIEPAAWGWIFSGALLGALLLGSVLLTMNLGHWYLVSRSLPLRLLFRAAVAYTTLAAARAIYLAAMAAAPPNRQGWAALTSLERDGLFFLFRIVWGIVGPVALSYFIFQTARMKSNQAATGLLYVALVFVLIGELLSAYLTVATGFPA
jgi:hypothetical protein